MHQQRKKQAGCSSKRRSPPKKEPLEGRVPHKLCAWDRVNLPSPVTPCALVACSTPQARFRWHGAHRVMHTGWLGAHRMMHTGWHGAHRMAWYTQDGMVHTGWHGAHRMAWCTQDGMMLTRWHGAHKLMHTVWNDEHEPCKTNMQTCKT
eukprot:1160958-Pelagomonas_calceolata.AAC.1